MYSTGWITENSDWPLSRLPGLSLQRRIDFPLYYNVQPILGLTKFGMRGTRHWRHALEICVFLGSYAACSGKFLPTFWNNRSVSRNPKRIYYYTLPNNTEERIHHKPENKLNRS